MSDVTAASNDEAIERTADIVSAYVSKNSLPITELTALIASVHAALTGLGKPATIEEPSPERPTPAQIRKSITPDALISFEDGKPYKALRRHLTLRGLSPEAYRAKWGLPSDYPMTSASYSAKRSALAHALGLGQQRRKAVPDRGPEPVSDTAAEPPKPRGRPRKVKEPA